MNPRITRIKRLLTIAALTLLFASIVIAEELTVARLRPGRDKMARAVALYGKGYKTDPTTRDLPIWADVKRGVFLRLELRDDQMINAVTIAAFGPDGVPPATLPPAAEASGRGLRLGDPLERALKLYGPPYFQGPSTEAGRDLILVVHKFSAEKDQPQILETNFDAKTRRLVKMTLSFPYY